MRNVSPMPFQGGAHGSSHGPLRAKQALHTGQSGTCHRATDLCQLGTCSGYETVQIHLPARQISGEIEHRNPQPCIGKHQTTSGAEDEPVDAMACEQIDRVLHGIFVAAADHEIRRPAHPESRPLPEIDPFVELYTSIGLQLSQPLPQVWRHINHSSTPVFRNLGTPIAYTISASRRDELEKASYLLLPPADLTVRFLFSTRPSVRSALDVLR
jgi:hypothetical protein